LLEIPLHTASNAQYRFDRLVHGLLSACALNIDDMSGRQGPMATKKIRNNLLAIVLILTVVPRTTKLSQVLVEHCCSLVFQKLVEKGEASLTAAYCIKTLVVASISGNVLLSQCSKILVPGMIEYITTIIPFLDDGTETHLLAMS